MNRTLLLAALLLASTALADEEEKKTLAEPTDERAAKAGTAPKDGAADVPSGGTRFEKDRVRSVQAKPFRKAGRLGLTALGSASINDPFYAKVGGSLGVAWHLADTLAVGARAGWIQALEDDDLRTARSNFQSAIVPASSGWSALGELQWAPLYGKVAAGESIIHFDGYFVGGLGTVSASTPELAFSLGVGARFAAKEWLAVELLFQNTSWVSTPAGGTLGLIQNLMTFNAGFTVFFPFDSPGGGAQ